MVTDSCHGNSRPGGGTGDWSGCPVLTSLFEEVIGGQTLHIYRHFCQTNKINEYFKNKPPPPPKPDPVFRRSTSGVCVTGRQSQTCSSM